MEGLSELLKEELLLRHLNLVLERLREILFALGLPDVAIVHGVVVLEREVSGGLPGRLLELVTVPPGRAVSNRLTDRRLALVVVASARANRVFLGLFPAEVALIAVVLGSEVESRQRSGFRPMSVHVPCCGQQLLEEGIRLNHSRNVGVVINKLGVAHIKAILSGVVLIKSLTELIKSLRLSSAAISYHGVGLCVVGRFHFADVNGARAVIVYRLEGLVNNLLAVCGQVTPDDGGELTVVDDLVCVLIEDFEQASDVLLTQLQLQFVKRRSELIQVESV